MFSSLVSSRVDGVSLDCENATYRMYRVVRRFVTLGVPNVVAARHALARGRT